MKFEPRFLIESAIHSDRQSSDGTPTEVATVMPTEDTTVGKLTQSYTYLRNLHAQIFLNIDDIIYHWINPRFSHLNPQSLISICSINLITHKSQYMYHKSQSTIIESIDPDRSINRLVNQSIRQSNSQSIRQSNGYSPTIYYTCKTPLELRIGTIMRYNDRSIELRIINCIKSG